MKKIGKVTLGGFLALLGISSLAACSNAEQSKAEEILSKVLVNPDGKTLSEDILIPKQVSDDGKAYAVSWVSTDTALLDFAESADPTKYIADIKRPLSAEDTVEEVSITASITYESTTLSETFKIKIASTTVEDALAKAISGVGVNPNYETEKANITLPTTSTEFKEAISLSYSLAATYETTTLVDGVLNIDPTKGNEKVELNVKAVRGTDELEKAVKIQVGKIEYLTVTEVLAEAKGTLLYAQGRITKIDNEKYGNVYIAGADNTELYIYGLYQGDNDACYVDGAFVKTAATGYSSWAAEDKLKVGDYIYIYGQRWEHNGKQQMQNNIIQPYPFTNVSDTLDLALNQMVTIVGTVKEVSNPTYGNLVLTDGTKNIEIYGVYQGDIAVCYEGTTWKKDPSAKRYDAWEAEDKFSAGDVVVVTGVRSEYNGKQQVSNTLIELRISKVAAPVVEPDPEPNPNPNPPTGTVTASLLKGKSAGEAFTCEAGKVVAIHAQDKVVVVATKDGSFGINCFDAEEGSVLLSLVVGDIVKVEGTLSLGAKGGTAKLLILTKDATITKLTDTNVEDITFTAINWATDGGEKWLYNLTADTAFGAYVEFTNVKFASLDSSVANGNWSKIAPQGDETTYTGLYAVDAVDSAGNALDKTSTYTVKAYIVGMTDFVGNGKAANNKVRLCPVSIVKNA